MIVMVPMCVGIVREMYLLAKWLRKRNCFSTIDTIYYFQVKLLGESHAITNFLHAVV